MDNFKYIVLITLLVGCLAIKPTKSEPLAARDKHSKSEEVIDSYESDLFNKLYPYEYPVLIKRDSSPDERIQDNVILSKAFADLERESSSPDASAIKPKPFTPNEFIVKKVAPEPVPSIQGGSFEAPARDSTLEKAKSIAFNSREVRLVGPDQREVEMKDDVATKVVIALENIQKDASELWDQVNEKLDQGWTDLKAMVEKAVAPASAKLSPATTSRKLRDAPNEPGKSSLVVVSDIDGYSMADSDLPQSLQSDSAGTKLKGFLSGIGLNEENQKKAGDALSSAGSAVSDTVSKDIPDAFKKASDTVSKNVPDSWKKAGDAVSEAVNKDIPDALKKAGDAVSETVTKDIPNAFKNFFG